MALMGLQATLLVKLESRISAPLAPGNQTFLSCAARQSDKHVARTTITTSSQQALGDVVAICSGNSRQMTTMVAAMLNRRRSL